MYSKPFPAAHWSAVAAPAFRSRPAIWVFAAACKLVAVISVHDAILVVLHEDIIAQVEQNPIGRLLLEVPDVGLWLFVFLKLVGTAVVCATLITLFQHRQRLGLVVGWTLAAVQLALLGYLTFG